MTAELTIRGHRFDLAEVIEALERSPDRPEIVQAVQDLRRDRVKRAVGETVKAARFDIDQALKDFLDDGEKAERTCETYERESFNSRAIRSSTRATWPKDPDVASRRGRTWSAHAPS